MGNNAAFSEMEFYVITLYDKGVLDKELLSTILERYRGIDIDSGGKEGTLTKDGRDVEEVILSIFGIELRPRPVLPKDYKTWTPEQELENNYYWDWFYNEFETITNTFGWR